MFSWRFVKSFPALAAGFEAETEITCLSVQRPRQRMTVASFVKIPRAPFVRFCLVGTIGFCIDASVLQIVVQYWGVDPYLGRVLSYLVAATATWGLNRRFTFGPGGAEQWQHQWARYVIVNAVGAGVNYGTYAACVWSFALVRQYLILGVAVGSIAALVFNFTASRRLVFRDC